MSTPLPDELLIEIFSCLLETDLVYCMGACKDWYRVTNDLSLLYIENIFSKTLSFETLLINCCQHNHILSFDKALQKLNNIFPQINYHNLWTKCINAACKEGHFALFKRLHNFAIYNSEELIKLAKDKRIVKFLCSDKETSSKINY